MTARVRSRAALVAGIALVAAAAYGVSLGSAAPSIDTLVVDRSFEIRTADPQRAFEPTASIVNRGVYDTLLTFRGSDVSKPVLMAARGYKASKDAKTYTFELRRDIRFADGTPMTAADVVFSFRRLINLKGNPAFLLGLLFGGKAVLLAVPFQHVRRHGAAPNGVHIPGDVSFDGDTQTLDLGCKYRFRNGGQNNLPGPG